MQMFLVEMRYQMENNTKQLSLSQRIKIENMLNQRCRKYEIAKEIGKNQSTIAREINKHHIIKPHDIFKNDNTYNCKYFINCKVCTGKCRIYQPISCKERDRNIGACNNCPNIKYLFRKCFINIHKQYCRKVLILSQIMI